NIEEHERWRATRDERPDVVLPEPPRGFALSATERAAFDRWYSASMSDQQHASAAPFSEMQIEVLGALVAAERQRAREELGRLETKLHTVIERCNKLTADVDHLQRNVSKAEILTAVHGDIAQIRSQLELITKSSRVAADVIDLRKGAA